LKTAERERTPENWLRACEVSALFVQAGMFRVPWSTLRDWAESGKIASVRTLGGHRRYRESEIRALLAELGAVA
jgi:excisionase family DNA binding protein